MMQLVSLIQSLSVKYIRCNIDDDRFAVSIQHVVILFAYNLLISSML